MTPLLPASALYRPYVVPSREGLFVHQFAEDFITRRGFPENENREALVRRMIGCIGHMELLGGASKKALFAAMVKRLQRVKGYHRFQADPRLGGDGSHFFLGPVFAVVIRADEGHDGEVYVGRRIKAFLNGARALFSDDTLLPDYGKLHRIDANTPSTKLSHSR